MLPGRRGPELSNEHSMIIFPIARCPNCPLNYTFLSTHPSLCGCSGGTLAQYGDGGETPASHVLTPLFPCSSHVQCLPTNSFSEAQAAHSPCATHPSCVTQVPAAKLMTLSFNMHSCLDSCETPEHRHPKNPETKGLLSTTCLLQKIPHAHTTEARP